MPHFVSFFGFTGSFEASGCKGLLCLHLGFGGSVQVGVGSLGAVCFAWVG